MHTVLETPSYKRAVKLAGLSEDEQVEIIKAVALQPDIGDLIKGTGGARKFRFGGQGAGKRSAYRVITYFAANDVPVFLLDIYSKGEKVNLSQSERNDMKAVLGGICDDYRKAMAQKVAELRRNVS